MNDPKEMAKRGIVAGLLIVAAASVYYFHLVVKTEIVYTHLFYIPIILAAIWWGRKGVSVALLLAIQLCGFHLLTGKGGGELFLDGVRAVMFIVIAFLVSSLSERVKRSKDLLEASGRESERKVQERTAELSAVNALLGTDLAERKKAEAEAKAATTKLSYLTKYANDFIILLDEKFNFLETNERVMDFYGYTREELLGMNATQFRAPEVKAAFAEQIKPAQETGKVVYETLHQRRDGKKFPVEISLRAFEVDGKRRYQAILRDITERKQAEDSLLAAMGKIKKMNDQMADFVANASHEIRGSLAIIKESLDLVGSGTVGPVNKEQKECIEAGMRTLERLVRLLGNLLNLAKIESGQTPLEKTTVAIEPFMKELVIPYLSQMSQKGMTLQMDMPPDIGVIQADRDKLSEVILNLLSNAIKYTPVSGAITLKWGSSRDEVRFEIENTGPSIPRAFLGKVFDKFVRINANGHEGTGLGLSIAKEIVELHRGKIWAESPAWEKRPVGQQGNRFLFTLPRNPVKNPGETAVPRASI